MLHHRRPARHSPCRASVLLATIVFLWSGLARAETLVCHLSYGGETVLLRAQPVASPYGVPVRAIGSYFLFRMVFQTAPRDLAAIKLYVFGEREGEPVPIHQATYPYPPRDHGAGYGFTGLQAVYEPVRDGEIQYWCELPGQRRGRR